MDDPFDDLYSQDPEAVRRAISALQVAGARRPEHVHRVLQLLVTALVNDNGGVVWDLCFALAVVGSEEDTATLRNLWLLLARLFPDPNLDSAMGHKWSCVRLAYLSLVSDAECERLATEGDSRERYFCSVRAARGHDVPHLWRTYWAP